MKKVILIICLCCFFTGQVYAAKDIELQQDSIDENNGKVIELQRKNSQQSIVIIELQQKIMKLEYHLSKMNGRLKRLESIVYKNMK